MTPAEHRQKLTNILKHAYSGERAAAYAYRGHWRSLKNPIAAERIQKIESEEWHHRDLVGGLLNRLGERPSPWLEFKALLIGKTAGFLCHVTGWFAPMYGAGRLERMNIQEYEVAARHAVNSGREDFMDCLLAMAEIEWDHEDYFRGQVNSHFLSKYVPVWRSPPPREAIRQAYRAAAP